ncbi:MAG: GNAT family N-acetyltransferase [Cyclobacteriaceae bacterium]
MESYLFESERLGFRNWQDQDLAPFAQMNADTKVMEYFPSTLNLDQSNEGIQKLKAHFDINGFMFYATCRLIDHQFVGFIGLKRVTLNLDFAPCVEIGWRLAAHHWGKGYATEGAKKVISIAPEFGIHTIHSFTAVTNKRSEQVMIKCGMNHVSYFEHPLVDLTSDLRKHTLYKIDLK